MARGVIMIMMSQSYYVQAHRAGVRDQFIGGGGGGEGTHIFGPFCPNPESTARIPTSAETSPGGGGGGGLCTFFNALEICSIL